MLTCPDCDEPLAFAFLDTSGVGAHKRGDSFNTTPDTSHYLCFPCTKAWKRRLTGPLTPDIVGDLAFFTCRRPDCGTRLEVTSDPGVAPPVELACPSGHQYVVRPADDGLALAERR
jgi:hypothetical protein